MKFFIIFTLWALWAPTPNLLNVLSPIVQHAHNFCFTFQPQNISQPEIWRALVCGENLSNKNSTKNDFIFSQLIHLIVVSGSHFLVLFGILNFLKTPPLLSGFVMIIFALATGFQPPSVRGLIAILISIYSYKHKVLPHGDQRSLLTLFICLMLQPLWIESWSLFLSAICALALNAKLPKISSHAKVFTLLLPIEALWNQVNPLGLLTNYLLADMIGWILFPLALLSILPITYFCVPYDFFVQFLTLLLKKISIEFNPVKSTITLQLQTVPFSYWIYLIFIHSFVHFLRLQRFTEKLQESES